MWPSAQSGAGANREGTVHLCIGTATWIGVSTSTFRNDPVKPFWGLNHIDPNKYIIAGEMETGGGALMWFRDALGAGGEAAGDAERPGPAMSCSALRRLESPPAQIS